MSNLILKMYERRDFIMSKKKHDKDNKKKNSNPNRANGKESNSKVNSILQITAVIINTLVSVGLITFMITFYGDFRELKSDVKHSGSITQDNRDDIEDLVSNTINKESFNSTINSLRSDLSGFKQSVGKQIVYIPTKLTKQKLSITKINNDDNKDFLSSTAWSDDDEIAKNPNTGKKYKAKDLKNQKILLPYTENNQEIYFWGQFNNKHHWDGNCIINIYKKNKLEVIMDGLYSDGNLISYRRISYHTNNSKIEVWNLSDRKPNDNKNSGSTYTYFKESNYRKGFNLKNVESKDILSVSDFMSVMQLTLEGFYYGETSGGRYNDKSDNAYLIKYFEDGTVRTLYCGNFKNGEFDDNTNDAWYISIGDDDKNYVYYKGQFSQGDPCETKNNKRENISNKKIHEIIDNMNFQSDVKLRGDENKKTT